MKKFIGRAQELSRLRALMEKKAASFVVINGRRRVGKSRLIEEYGTGFDQFYYFEGLPPEQGVGSKEQLAEFSRLLAQKFKIPLISYQDWGDAFWMLGERVQKGRILLVFDEISWMSGDDPTFLGKIKNIWDQSLKKNHQLVFILCGSASSWIDKNILSSSGFVGRISYTLTLGPLPLKDCNSFWPKNVSAHEKLKILSVIGGIPKYLEEINPKKSAEENIKNLCFTPGGFLVDEFDRIFSDILLRNSEYYAKIIKALAGGDKDKNQIKTVLNLTQQGRLPEYLKELELAGFISRDFTWDLKSSLDGKLSIYRLSDNYLRFYVKYIEKNISRIQRGLFELKSLASLPEWDILMGLQFENLVLANREFIHTALGIGASDIVCENPYFQKKTQLISGCQVDYMIQTKFNTLYLCEIKFSKSEIDLGIIPEMQKKIDAIKYPKYFSCRPVLIHVNGVKERLIEEDYFAEIIDFTKILNP